MKKIEAATRLARDRGYRQPSKFAADCSEFRALGCFRDRDDLSNSGCFRDVLPTVAILLLAIGSGCTQEMFDQPRHEVLEASTFFPDAKSARRAVEGTVARGKLWLDDPFFTGQNGGEPVSEIPPDPRASGSFEVTLELLRRGRQRFDIFCSVCHGRAGYGDGMVVRRGFLQPPSLHERRLREETPPGHFFGVITNGFRTMPAQGSRISAADRWAIVAYIRVLQASHSVILDDAPADIRQRFD